MLSSSLHIKRRTCSHKRSPVLLLLLLACRLTQLLHHITMQFHRIHSPASYQ